MVAILGQQETLSSTASGAFVGRYDALALENGSIVTAAADGFGPISLFLAPGAGAASETVATLGGLTNQTIELFGLPDGGFGVAYNAPADDRGGDDNATVATFGPDGAPRAAPEAVATGDITAIEAAGTGRGYAVAYHDRTDDTDERRVAEFYRADGRLLGTVENSDAGGLASSGRMDLLALANGDVAIAWQTDVTENGVTRITDFVQVHAPNGRPVGDPVALPDAVTSADTAFDAWAALPDGGFVVAELTQTLARDLVTIQVLGADGTLRGEPLSLDAGRADTGADAAGGLSLAVGRGGLLGLAWEHNYRQGFDTNVDSYFEILSPDGAQLFGPVRVNEVIPGLQRAPEILTMPDGDFYVTHLDEEFVPFGYQDAVQGVRAGMPDTVFVGTAEDDGRAPTPGDDARLGLGGDDSFAGGRGADYLSGGPGADQLAGGPGRDTLLGGDGDDRLSGKAWADQLAGGAGDDTLRGGNGDDQVEGGSGDDRIFAGLKDDTVLGGDGADVIRGGAGADDLGGDAGADVIRGGAAGDRISGGDGDDRLVGQRGDDRLDGGAGDDRLLGWAGDDRFFGGDGADRSFGGTGADVFDSGSGNDREFGGSGDDAFFDSDGNDRTWGGDGADRFVFQDTEFGRDRIKDFETGVDVLDMGAVARSLGLAGADPVEMRDVPAGTLFLVDAENWVIVEGTAPGGFGPDDLILTDPLA